MILPEYPIQLVTSLIAEYSRPLEILKSKIFGWNFIATLQGISKSRQEFHTSGYAWRYIRASMSLAGLLPPLCDEGNMLLDGGMSPLCLLCLSRRSINADN